MKTVEALGILLFSGYFFCLLVVLTLTLLSVTVGVIGLNYFYEKNLLKIKALL